MRDHGVAMGEFEQRILGQTGGRQVGRANGDRQSSPAEQNRGPTVHVLARDVLITMTKHIAHGRSLSACESGGGGRGHKRTALHTQDEHFTLPEGRVKLNGGVTAVVPEMVREGVDACAGMLKW
jgi:hypothetical protein